MVTLMHTLQQKLYSFLRWSEKYTKTDMVYLTHGGFWLSLGTLATALCSFGLSLAFANFIPAAVYGTYKYILSIASVFNAFTLTGLATAVVVGVSSGKEGVMKQAFWANLRWSIPTSTAAFIGALYYFYQGNTPLGVSLILIAFIQPITVSVAFADSFLAGKKAFKLNALNYIIDNAVPTLALVGVMLISKNALLIIATYFLANLATTTGMYWYVVHRFKPNTTEDDSAITYGKHLSAMGVLTNLADNFDKILTFHFLGPAQLAIYSFALALPMQSKLITKPLGNLLFPKFVARSSTELRQSMGEKTLRFFLFSIVMSFGYILIAPFAFSLFYPHYTNAVWLSQIFAISLLGISFVPMGTFLSAKRKVRAQYATNIITSVFQLVSAFFGMIFLGLLGLILSRVATRFLGGIISVFFYYTDQKEEHTP